MVDVLYIDNAPHNSRSTTEHGTAGRQLQLVGIAFGVLFCDMIVHLVAIHLVDWRRY
jgi:hypothetical protein